MDLIKQIDKTGAPVEILEEAAKKGSAGVTWLKKGGGGHHLVVKTKIAARVAKNVQLGRLHELLTILAKKYFWNVFAIAIFCLFVGLAFLANGMRCLKSTAG
ncbi:hypothetical protein [Desulfuromonas thiophila]|uniref:hypothetical protein n=1 Tax=Desulfuromonas thiophila TaxID=57664 RepID=UPI0029F4898C|nr:hypothetical protein [Desulfuromonas thiophila]